MINLEVITLPFLSLHVNVSCLFSRLHHLMQTYFFLYAVAITFNFVFCFFYLTLQHNYFSMLLSKSHNQGHGLYNTLVRCMIVYLNLAIGHLSHMVLLKME